MALIRGGLRTRLVLVTMLIATLVMAAVVVLVQVYLARVSDADSTRLGRARADAVAGTVRVKDGRVVKGVHFETLRDAGDPVAQAARYDAEGADEPPAPDPAPTRVPDRSAERRVGT